MTDTPETTKQPEQTAAKPEVQQAAPKATTQAGPTPTQHTGGMGPSPNDLGHTNEQHRRHDIPRPNTPRPRNPIPFDRLQRNIIDMSNAIGKLIVKGALIAAALTGFVKKETQAPTAENQSPKAVLTAGALGMTLMKTEINNGNKATDFDGKLILAETAHEIANKLSPELTTKPFFEKNPIENGVFGKTAKDVLQEASEKKTHILSAQEIAKKLGRGGR